MARRMASRFAWLSLPGCRSKGRRLCRCPSWARSARSGIRPRRAEAGTPLRRYIAAVGQGRFFSASGYRHKRTHHGARKRRVHKLGHNTPQTQTQHASVQSEHRDGCIRSDTTVATLVARASAELVRIDARMSHTRMRGACRALSVAAPIGAVSNAPNDARPHSNLREKSRSGAVCCAACNAVKVLGVLSASGSQSCDRRRL